MTEAFQIDGHERTGRWLVTCDHASNAVPVEIADGSLGLPEQDMSRHIAYDVGAAGVARALGEALDGSVVMSGISRLVIDPNRGEDDPTLIMKLYDGTLIPENRHVDATERERRLNAYYRPYDEALAHLADRRPDTAIVAVHSFTGRLRGRAPRPWQIGVLSAHDRRLAEPFLHEMAHDAAFATWVEDVSGTPLCLGDNQPYAGHLPGDVIDRHALSQDRPNVLLELRQDLITTQENQVAWAHALAPLLKRALLNSGL